MKILKEFINEALNYDVVSQQIEEWIRNNYYTGYERSMNLGKITIKKKPNKDGKYIVDCSGANEINIRSHATALTNDLFVWGKVRNFGIQDNNNITSLEGCPVEVENFSVMNCNNLKSLAGMPKVTRWFNFGHNGIKSTEEELKDLSDAPTVEILDK